MRKEKNLPFIDRVEDYSQSSVPTDQRRSAFSQFVIWVGWAIWPGSLLAGGAIGMGMSIYKAIWSIIVGCILLFILHIVFGSIGQKTGMSTPIIARRSWGTWGRIIPSILYAVALWGWFGVLIGLTGPWFYDIVGFGNKWLWCFVFGILFTSAAIYGFKVIAWISDIGSPTILFICVWGLIKALELSGGWDGLVSKTPTSTMSFGAAIGLTMANWAVATSASPDFYRYAKNLKGVAAGAFGGMILGNGGTMVIGAILAAGTGNPDLMVIMTKLGLYSVAIWFLVAGVWTSAQTNVYVSSLSLSNIFKVRRFWMAILCGFIGTLVGGFGLYNVFIQWLIILGVIFPGIIGIYVADYWLTNRGKYEEGAFSNVKYKINIRAIIAWIVALTAEYFLGKANIGIQFLNGFLIGLVVYTLLSLIFVRKEVV